MEQDITGMNDVRGLPGNLPNDIDEPGSAELAADLLSEQATEPIPLGPTTPGQGEDTVLLVETAMVPDQTGALSPEDTILGGIDLEEASPWYRSRWLYLGAGLAGGAALAAGTVFLIRSRNTRQSQAAIARAQSLVSQWPSQLSEQAGRLTSQVSRITSQASRPTRQTGVLAWQMGRLSGQASRLTRQKRRPARRIDTLTGQMSRLTGQASKLSGQAQGQISRLAGRIQGATVSRMPLQRQTSPTNWLRQTQQQLTNLSQQAGGQLSSIGSSIGTTTRAASAQAIGKTQESLAQVRQGVAAGAARTGEGIKSGWKFSRNFTLGMTAGAVWAALFTPQSGETTRQHLSSIFQSRWPRNQ
jgi:gas vesicle protein